MRKTFHVMSFFLAAAFPNMARGQETTLRSICDQAAASPLDENRPQNVKGVDFSSIESGIAISACEAAHKAKPGDARITFQLGRAYAAASRYEEARSLLAEADAAGYLLASNNLAELLIHGKGGAKDTQQAITLFERAANGGVGIAARNLGGIYSKEEDVPKDLVSARKWLRRGADLSDAASMYELGNLLRLGLGGPANPAEALQYYKMSAEAGNILGSYFYGLGLLDGSAGYRDEMTGMYWLQKAADGGVAKAYEDLGVMYGYGTDKVAKNPQEAQRLIEKAIQLGDTDAKITLQRLNQTLASSNAPPSGAEPPAPDGAKGERSARAKAAYNFLEKAALGTALSDGIMKVAEQSVAAVNGDVCKVQVDSTAIFGMVNQRAIVDFGNVDVNTINVFTKNSGQSAIADMDAVSGRSFKFWTKDKDKLIPASASYAEIWFLGNYDMGQIKRALNILSTECGAPGGL